MVDGEGSGEGSSLLGKVGPRGADDRAKRQRLTEAPPQGGAVVVGQPLLLSSTFHLKL